MTDMLKQASSHDQDRTKRFLLVVDSDPSDLFYTGSLLQNFGYTVHSFSTAEEAREFMSVAVPALVITELKLSGMNGFDLLTYIRRNPGTTAVPVIILTAITGLGSEEQCMLGGCTLYLRKPLHAADLYRAVQTAIESTPRQNIRISTHLPAMSEGAEGPEFITVLSEEGLYLKTLHPRPVHTRLPISFTIGNRTITVDAVVLYSFSFNEGPFKEPGMGMKFIHITPGDRALLQEFVQEKLVEGMLK